MAKKTAVVLFNLGGPDNQDAVRPFLFNLFNDKAIISLPNPFRYLLAKIISSRRAPIAKEIYSHIGGKSPILEETKRQAVLLESALNESECEYKTFIAMRYWKPFTEDAVGQVLEYNPDEVILLPLYPHFSTTTTGSSFNRWNDVAAKKGLNVSTKTICCYPEDDDFINSHVNLIKNQYKKNFRILFSAHGLPKKIIEGGDPYQWQIEQTADKIVKKLDIDYLDFSVCYQSRVGPLEWIGPSLDDEIKLAAKEGVSVIVVPIAFVSEHSETLVELDIEYKEMAKEEGISEYIRIPTLSVEADFIKSLKEICLSSGSIGKVCSKDGSRICPIEFSRCPMEEVNG